MKYDLISLTTFPSMPAPWSSQGEGETWVWGNFFGTIQKKPQSIADGIMAMTGQKNPMPGGIVYHYAMTVFYHKDKNPHGPSSRPVLSVGIEQIIMNGMDTGMPIMVGLFKSTSRLNLGDYEGNLNLGDARNEFFKITKSELKLRGEPQKNRNNAGRLGAPSNWLGKPGWREQ